MTVLGNVADQELLNLLPGGIALQMILWPTTPGGLLMLILGVLVAGSEYGWGTIKTVLTRRPGRVAVFGGKVLVLVVVATSVVPVIFALAAATSMLIAQARRGCCAASVRACYRGADKSICTVWRRGCKPMSSSDRRGTAARAAMAARSRDRHGTWGNLADLAVACRFEVVARYLRAARRSPLEQGWSGFG